MAATKTNALLVQRVRAGNAEAWRQFIERFEGRLFAFVDSRPRDPTASEDVVEETFIGFLSGLAHYDEKRDTETYLFSIAAHKLTDYLRRQGRRPIDEIGTDDRGRPSDSSLTALEREELLLLVRKAQISGDVSDEMLAHLRAVQHYACSAPEGARALDPVSLGEGQLLELSDLPPDVWHSAQPDARSERATVLETFDGCVERIDSDTAYVTLQSRLNGDVEEGTYSASELAKMGIHEQSCFVFKTVDVGNAIRPVFEPIPEQPLAAEVVREIDAKIDQLLPHEERWSPAAIAEHR